MKKKLIATAVAGALVSPGAMAAMDGPDVNVYFRINNALDYTDTDGGDSAADLANVSSRIGVKGSQDLGNGMSVFGQYEFSTFTDREGAQDGRGGINDTRIGIVGIKGPFGSVSAGNQWSAFYDTVGTHMEPTYSLGYYVYSSDMGGPYRESNAVKYSNSFGPVYIEVDTRFSQDSPATGQDVEKIGGDHGKDFLDGFGIGASFAATDNITLAAAYDSEIYDVGDNEDRIGVGGQVSFGSMWVKAGYMDYSQDSTGIDRQMFAAFLGTSIGENSGAWVGYQHGDNDAGQNPNAILLHADHKVGGGPLKLYYEGIFYDGDGSRPDFNRHLLGMRIDF